MSRNLWPLVIVTGTCILATSFEPRFEGLAWFCGVCLFCQALPIFLHFIGEEL